MKTFQFYCKLDYHLLKMLLENCNKHKTQLQQQLLHENHHCLNFTQTSKLYLEQFIASLRKLIFPVHSLFLWYRNIWYLFAFQKFNNLCLCLLSAKIFTLSNCPLSDVMALFSPLIWPTFCLFISLKVWISLNSPLCSLRFLVSTFRQQDKVF